AEIWHTHLRCADALARSGVHAGDLVLSAVGNSSVAPAWLLACRALDAAMMPIDAGAAPQEIEALAGRFGGAAIVNAAGVSPVAGERRCYPDAAMLKLTSGSSGVPRATRTTEAQLVADCEHIVEAMEIRSGDTQLAAIPLSHSYGIGNLLLPLLMHGTPL